MPIINLTRVPITLRPEGSTAATMTLPPTPTPPHLHDVIISTDPATATLPLPQVNVRRGDGITELPAPTRDTWYVVARVVADALAGSRDDLLVPGPALAAPNPDGLTIATFLRIVDSS